MLGVAFVCPAVTEEAVYLTQGGTLCHREEPPLLVRVAVEVTRRKPRWVERAEARRPHSKRLVGLAAPYERGDRCSFLLTRSGAAETAHESMESAAIARRCEDCTEGVGDQLKNHANIHPIVREISPGILLHRQIRPRED